MEPKDSIPHASLLQDLQLGMLTIFHQLPIVSSMLRWAKAASEGGPMIGAMGWMIVVDPEWTKQDQIDHLTALRRSIIDLKAPLDELLLRLGDFSHIQPLRKAITSFYNAYQELPLIEPELQLLQLGHNIFEDKAILPHLIDYIEKVSKLQEQGSHLKHLLVHEVINRLNH